MDTESLTREMVDILYARNPLPPDVLAKYPRQEWIRKSVLLNCIRSRVSELYWEYLPQYPAKPWEAWDAAIVELHRRGV